MEQSFSSLEAFVTPEKSTTLIRAPGPPLLESNVTVISSDTSPVLTVEGFLGRSATRRIKTYKKRKRPVPLIEQSDNEGKRNDIPLIGARKRPRETKALLQCPRMDRPILQSKNLHQNAGPTSCLADAAQLTHADDSHNSLDLEGTSVVPLDLIHVNDLDIFRPKKKAAKVKKWILVDPRKFHHTGFPLSDLTSNVSEPLKVSKAGRRPLTYWRDKFFLTTDPYPSVARYKSKEPNASPPHGPLPLQFVSWRDHEEGVKNLKILNMK